jgi:quercetin dioxygenase-like cupin family protein
MKILCGAAFLFSFAILAAIPVEPGTTFFENDQVKAVRALEKAHVKGKAHEHKMNRVMVYLQSGKQRFEYQDGRKPATFDWKAGQVVWSPASGMHAPEVVSDDPFNIVEVELKNTGSATPISSNLDPLKLAPKNYQLEFENNQVRVVRVHIGPHESVPLHQHGLNRVTVYLTDQNFKATMQDGNVDEVHHKAGEALWGTPLTHKEENLSDKPFEAISIEIK